jgi:hypothetical protein
VLIRRQARVDLQVMKEVDHDYMEWEEVGAVIADWLDTLGVLV